MNPIVLSKIDKYISFVKEREDATKGFLMQPKEYSLNDIELTSGYKVDDLPDSIIYKNYRPIYFVLPCVIIAFSIISMIINQKDSFLIGFIFLIFGILELFNRNLIDNIKIVLDKSYIDYNDNKIEWKDIEEIKVFTISQVKSKTKKILLLILKNNELKTFEFTNCCTTSIGFWSIFDDSLPHYCYLFLNSKH